LIQRIGTPIVQSTNRFKKYLPVNLSPGEGCYQTHGFGWALRESAPSEEAMSERTIFVKCNSRAPIICLEMSKALQSKLASMALWFESCTIFGTVLVDVLVVP